MFGLEGACGMSGTLEGAADGVTFSDGGDSRQLVCDRLEFGEGDMLFVEEGQEMRGRGELEASSTGNTPRVLEDKAKLSTSGV